MTTSRPALKISAMVKISFAHFFLAIVGFGLNCQAEAANGPGEALTLGKVEKPIRVKGTDLHADPSGINWRKVFTRAGADHLLFGLLNARKVKGVFTVEVRQNGNRVPILKINSNELKSPEAQFWVPVVNGDSIVVDIKARDIRRSFSSLDLAIAAGFRGGVVFSHQSPPRFEDIIQTNDSRLINAGKQVGALYFVAEGDWNVCSGFLVSPTQFVSNYHCVKTLKECQSARVIFDYQTLKDGSTQPGTWFSCRAVRFNDRLKALDIAVLTLNIPIEKWPQRPGLQLRPASSKNDLDSLAVIQHPGGAPLQVARHGCKADFIRVLSPTSLGSDDWAHECDTSVGSSGAPLINGSTMVVGVHHWGYEMPNFADRNRAISSITELRNFLTNSKNSQ